ncbi:MAG: hypothetical protein ACE5FG_04390 [Myxococcota bacterium]
MPPESRQRDTRSILLDLVLAIWPAALALVLLWGLVIPGVDREAPQLGSAMTWDFETYFLPRFVFGNQELLHGILPLWNRYESGGIPFLATAQPAALYLPKLLAFLIPDPGLAIRVFLIGHFLMLAVFFLVFARDQGIGRFGASLGALFWTLNIPFLLSNHHPVRIANLVWVPLLFLLVNRIARGAGVRGAALLAGVVAVQLTAGYPEFVLDCGLLLGLQLLLQTLPSLEWARLRRAFGLLALAIGLGAAVAALQVLPLAELVLHSGRAARAGLGVEHWHGVSVPVLDVGVPALLGFAIIALRGRRAIPVAGGLLACVFMTWIGWRLLRVLPGFSAVRLPYVWIFLSQFFLAWLVALGGDRLTARGEASRSPVSRGILIVMGAGWAALCLWSLWHPVAGVPHLTHAPVASILTAAGAVGASRTVNLLGIGGGGLLMLAGVAASRKIRFCTLAAGGVGLALAGQIAAYPYGVPVSRLAPPAHPLRTPSLVPPPEHPEGRVLSFFDLRGGSQLLERVENVFGLEGSLAAPRARALASRLGVVAQMMRMDWAALGRSPGLLDTLDVRLIVAPRDFAATFQSLGYRLTRYGEGNIAVFRRESGLGRAWVVYGATVVDDEQAALDALLAKDFNPARQVLVESPLRGRYAPRAQRPPTPARVRYPSPTEVEVQVDLTEAGVLVLADACFPGWSVRVDGQPAELHCANHLVRAVELAPGPHRVRFRYAPVTVRWGGRLSVAGTVALLALVARPRRRRDAGSRPLGS